jgi:hypothetical protein
VAQKEDYMECLHRTKEVSQGSVGTLIYKADHFFNSINITPIINHYTYFALYYSTSQFDHLPQIARAKEIKTHFLQKQAHESADARKAAERGATGAIVSLGLVEEEGGGK